MKRAWSEHEIDRGTEEVDITTRLKSRLDVSQTPGGIRKGSKTFVLQFTVSVAHEVPADTDRCRLL